MSQLEEQPVTHLLSYSFKLLELRLEELKKQDEDHQNAAKCLERTRQSSINFWNDHHSSSIQTHSIGDLVYRQVFLRV